MRRSMSGEFYEAAPFALPFDVYMSNFFRIKEWSDNTTTMDHLTSAAGLAAGVGVFDYIQWPIERIWAELPVTRSFDVATSPKYHDLGSNWHPNVTKEVTWDLPVSKQPDFGGGYLYSAYTNNNNNMMYPRVAIIKNNIWQAYVMSESVQLRSDANGTMRLVDHHTQYCFSTEPDWMADPTNCHFYQQGSDSFYNWYYAGNGTYGGLGNPELIKLDDVDHVYI